MHIHEIRGYVWPAYSPQIPGKSPPFPVHSPRISPRNNPLCPHVCCISLRTYRTSLQNLLLSPQTHCAFTVFHRTFATYRRMLAQTPIPKKIPMNRTVQFAPKRSRKADVGLIQAASKKTLPLWSKHPLKPRRPPTPPRAHPITNRAIPVITGTAPHLQPICPIAFSTRRHRTHRPHQLRPGHLARKSRDPASVHHHATWQFRRRLIRFIRRPTRYVHGQIVLALSLAIRCAVSPCQQKP